MALLRLPVAGGGGGSLRVDPPLGEYSRALVRAWLRDLRPARRDAACWPLERVWQAFARPLVPTFTCFTSLLAVLVQGDTITLCAYLYVRC
jgi:hypothetical protein